MFYAHIVLAKKGPLARIWLAAHWDKKLTKAHVFETNIEQSVEGIMQPKVKLALRTSGHLLLGVVRIYSRKAKYLLADCNEAFVKIKMAFRPGIVDLPEGHREAAVNAITLPEVFHDFDTALPDINDVDIEAQFSINQSRADEITMREDYGSLSMSIHDDGFGEVGFEADTGDLVRDGIDQHIDEHLFAEDLEKDIDRTKEPVPGTSKDLLGTDLVDPHLDSDGFGEADFQGVGLFEGDIFGEPSAPAQAAEINEALPPPEVSDDDLDHFDTGAPSPMASSLGSRPPTPLAGDVIRAPSVINRDHPAEEGLDKDLVGDAKLPGDSTEQGAEGLANEAGAADQSAIAVEEESFALAPVDATAYKGVTKAKRKRKLIVDEVKNISGEEMKSQLANTSDIVTTLDLAPPTKRLMYWKETGGVEKLFNLPSRDIPARCLFLDYQKRLITQTSGVEDFSMLGPADVLAIDQLQESESPVLAGKRGRKRKLPFSEIQPHQSSQSLEMSEVDQIREGEAASRLSLDIVTNFDPETENLMPPPATPGATFDSLRNYPLPDLSGLGPMTPALPSLPGMELTEDFDNIPPVTPVHPGIESIPVLPADQISSILAEESRGAHEQEMSTKEKDQEFGPHEQICTAAQIETQQDADSTHMLHEADHDHDGDIEYHQRFESADYADEYFPPSVGAHQPGDEQMENETDEAFEERVLNKRAAQMFVAVRNRLQKKDVLLLSDMTHRNHRKQAAQKFYSLLVLKKFRALEIHQDEPYGDITVTKGPMFDNPKL